MGSTPPSLWVCLERSVCVCTVCVAYINVCVCASMRVCVCLCTKLVLWCMNIEWDLSAGPALCCIRKQQSRFWSPISTAVCHVESRPEGEWRGGEREQRKDGRGEEIEKVRRSDEGLLGCWDVGQHLNQQACLGLPPPPPYHSTKSREDF